MVATVFNHSSCIYNHSSCIYNHSSCIYNHSSYIYNHSSCIYNHSSCIYNHSSSVQHSGGVIRNVVNISLIFGSHKWAGVLLPTSPHTQHIHHTTILLQWTLEFESSHTSGNLCYRKKIHPYSSFYSAQQQPMISHTNCGISFPVLK